MPHKFSIGTAVYYDGGFRTDAARGVYKIMKQLPVERDNEIAYRIKSPAETFERTAGEGQLRRSTDLP
jgi:hypothetical protein